MRLSSKFGLTITLAAVVTAATLGSLIHNKIRIILQQRAIDAQHELAHSILEKIDDTLSYARRDIRMLVEDEFLQAYVASPANRTETNHQLLEEELEERNKLTGPWQALMVLDRDGKHLLATKSHGGHGNIANYPPAYAAFQAAMSGRIYCSDLITPDHGGPPTLILAAPIRGSEKAGESREGEEQETATEEGEIIGVMVAHYQWSTISKILREWSLNGSVFLFNSAGEVIAEGLPGHDPAPPEHFLQHARVQMPATPVQAVATHESLHGDDVVLSTYVRQTERGDFLGNDWGLLIEQPEERIFAPARKLALQSALLVVSVLAILVILLTLLSYRLMRPLTWLTGMTERIGQGDFQQHIDYRGKDEVGLLASSFNIMVDQLEAHRDELLAAKNHIQRIVDTVPDILYTATPQGLGISYISPAVDKLLGYSSEEFLADPSLREKLLLESDREDTLAEIDAAKRLLADFVIIYRMRHKDGETIRWFEDRGSWEVDPSGQIVALHGMMVDVTERKLREAQLARTTRALDILHHQDTLLTRATSEAELIQGVCDNIIDKKVYQFAWIGLLDTESATQLHVAAYAGTDTRLTDLIGNTTIDASNCACPPSRAIRNKRVEIVQDLGAHPCSDEWVWKALEHEYASLISLPLISEGDVALGSLNIYSRNTNVFDSAEQRLLEELASNLSFGITALRTQALHTQAREQLAHQAFHDPLTGLPNRAMFMQSLQMAIAHAKRSGEMLAVLFIDLDEFKLVNDTLGHPAGDELLRQVGRRISAGIRGDDVVVRQGGDEFIVLMTGINAQPGNTDKTLDPDGQLLVPGRQAQRLIDLLSQPFVIEGQKTYIGASIGIASFPYDADDVDTLLRYADSAMYRAKELGRGNYEFYSAELTERQQKHMSLANRLHQALDKDEFVLYYQPLINLTTGTLAGVEALIRWQDKEGQLIPPGDFLPVAEDTGLIIPIGDWVLKEACWQIKAWQTQGLKLPIAINLSARQLWSADIAGTILNAIAETGISSDSLEVEITEPAMSRDPQHLESAFIRLHEGGIKIALDDFGTGYSSLSRLKHLPIHTLKIDKSFVDGIPGNEDDTAIVHATMQMAHSLGLRSLAEGIETKAQWQWLRKWGCQFGQGYFFSRPVAADEITAMLQQSRQWDSPNDD